MAEKNTLKTPTEKQAVRQPKHFVFGENKNFSECFRWFSPHSLYNFLHLKYNIIRDICLFTCLRVFC